MRLTTWTGAAAAMALLAPPLSAQEAGGPAPSGHESVRPDALTAEAIRGAVVHGPEGEVIGTVADLVLDPQGHLEAAVVAAGGVLGFGARHLALPIDGLSIDHAADDGQVRVISTLPAERLEPMPGYP